MTLLVMFQSLFPGTDSITDVLGVGEAKQENSEILSLRCGLRYVTRNGGRKEPKEELCPALFMIAMVSENVYVIFSTES